MTSYYRQINEDEKTRVRKLLEEYRYVVDYIVTHDCPTLLKTSVGGDLGSFNYLLAFFDDLQKNGRYKGWYFGKYHLDKMIPPMAREKHIRTFPHSFLQSLSAPPPINKSSMKESNRPRISLGSSRGRNKPVRNRCPNAPALGSGSSLDKTGMAIMSPLFAGYE